MKSAFRTHAVAAPLVALLLALSSGLCPATITLSNSEWTFDSYFIEPGFASNNFGLREAVFLSPSRTDAYDASVAIRVSGVNPDPWPDITLIDDVAKEVTFADTTINGFTLRDMRYVGLAGVEAMRLEFFLSNDTPNPVSGDLQVRWNLGADTFTTVVTTSSGDNIFDATDTWLVSDDANDTGGDPTTMVSWHTAPDAASLDMVDNGMFTLTYSVNLASGAQTSIFKVDFGIAFDRTSATAAAPLLASAAPIPEPGTTALLTAALGGFGVMAWRRRRSRKA